MLDIHAHLFWDSYDVDRDEVIRRAREAGVEKMICVGTSPEDNPQAIAVAEKYENVFASVGIHPHHFNEIGREFSIPNFQFSNKSQFFNSKIQICIEELRKLTQNKKVVAIGECGLDYYVRQSANNSQQKTITERQKKFQKEGFLAQIALAQESGLPLIIHTRPSVGSMDAYEDILGILKANEAKKPAKLKAVLHCYQGDIEITEKFLTLPNVYFSFAGNVTYPVKKALVGTKDDLTETVIRVPLSRLFIETDCPFLAPQGKRGERNEPAYALMTAEKVRTLKGIGTAVLEEALDENFQEVFARKNT